MLLRENRNVRVRVGGFRHSSLVVVDLILDRDKPTPVPITVSNTPLAICPPQPCPRAFTLHICNFCTITFTININ